MNVLIISPGYPAENPQFTRGLAEIGVRVFGIGDQPQALLPAVVRKCLSGYIHVPSLWDEAGVVRAVRAWPGSAAIHRVECLWEPGMMLAARLRQALACPGLTVQQTLPFRNKETMKQVLDKAGIRTPRHVSATTATACWEAANQIGFPVILKPIAGAGSADTYRVNSADELRAVLPRLNHVPEVSVEEFIEGDEFTFDTVTVDGRIAYYNIAWYRPRPLIARTFSSVSPQVVALRRVDQPMLKDGIKMGFDVIKALEFDRGFTHMEWYRKADGEVVFGEIGARPPGAHQVDQMNYACDFDVYREWANAVCFGRFETQIERRYNVATIYKRALGQGHIARRQGYRSMYTRFGKHIVWDTLLPVGSRRRNWRQTLVSDGFIMLRHPELNHTLQMADDVGTKLKLFAK